MAAGFMDSLLLKLGLVQPAGDAPDPGDYIGGDPVMAKVATGADKAATDAAQQAVYDAADRKGAPLSDAETDAILSQYPTADPSIATAHNTVKRVANEIRKPFDAVMSALKWVGIALVGAVVIGLFYRVKGD